MGVKTSMLPWNHEGLLVVSRRDGETAAVKLICDQSEGEGGEYGLHRWEQQEDDGSVFYDEVLFLDVQDPGYELGGAVTVQRVLDAFLDPGNGTVLIALGLSGVEDTFLATGEGGAFDQEGDIEGSSKCVNERFWGLPLSIEVHELRTQQRQQWPRSESEAYGPQRKPDRRLNRRTIEGARYYLEEGDYKHEAANTVVLSDGTNIHWYLWPADTERRMIHSYARRHGYVAALYGDELYHLTDHAFTYRRFGIIHRDVRKRLTLIIEPPGEGPGRAGVYPHGSRSSLLWSGAQELPWDRWSKEFIEDLPDEIRRALLTAGSSDAQDPESGAWMEQILSKFQARFRRIRFVPKSGGNRRADLSDSSGGGGGGGGAGPRHARRGRRRDKSGEEVEERTAKEGLPLFRWVSEAEIGEAGRAAVFVPHSAGDGGAAVVLINREFPAFSEVFSHWMSEYPAHMEQEVQTTIERVYGTELAAKVAHAQELRGHKEWTSDEVDRLLSPESLTFGALGLFACDQVISTQLGGRLGKKSSKRSTA